MFARARVLHSKGAVRRRMKSLALPHLLAASSCLHSAPARGLTIALVGGSTRTSPPPTVLHPRVNAFVARTLRERGHGVAVVDPADFPLLERPHFAYPPGRAPSKFEELHAILRGADAYVCVTPEYNHSPSPALLNVLNHFGSSTFSFKPSAIVTYSAGQWGGTRAGVALRTTISELGCLPVSAMIHIPKAQEVLDRDGNVVASEGDGGGDDPEERWRGYCGRYFSQLEWWAEASRRHRGVADPFDESPAFAKAPDQRNAP